MAWGKWPSRPLKPRQVTSDCDILHVGGIQMAFQGLPLCSACAHQNKALKQTIFLIVVAMGPRHPHTPVLTFRWGHWRPWPCPAWWLLSCRHPLNLAEMAKGRSQDLKTSAMTFLTTNKRKWKTNFKISNVKPTMELWKRDGEIMNL